MANPTLEDLYAAYESYKGFSLNSQQKRAIESDSSATWILAGPGTGKTETLVVRVLRLLLVDDVNPESIFFATFTNRAARNLEDRLARYLDGIQEQEAFPERDRPNISQIWIGTLHRLAHDLLNQMKSDTKETTLLDEEAALFRLLQELNSGMIRNENLYSALNGHDVPIYQKSNRIHFAERLKTGIDRTVEDNPNWEALENNRVLRGSNPWPDTRSHRDFIDAVYEYEDALNDSLDFARIQREFLNFLQSSDAEPFLNGSDEQRLPGINHVIIDEYQDTNPIQEQLYFELAQYADSFVVVGDDDQALYRFRGASVDAMVNFDQRISDNLGISPESDELTVVELVKNYRSRDRLVDALNDYIQAASENGSFKAARSPKGELIPKAEHSGTFPPIQLVVGEDPETLASTVAETIRDLQENDIITDPRQTALLSHSTKVTSRSPFNKYQSALEDQNLAVFNPGAKNMHKDRYLKGLLGILSLLLDPNDDIIRVEGGAIQEYVGYGDSSTTNSLRSTGRSFISNHPDLKEWFEQVRSRINQQAENSEDYPSNWNLLDLFYGILNNPPFAQFLDETGGAQEAQESWRFGWLSSVIESYQQNLPANGRLLPAEENNWTEDFYQYRDYSVPDRIRGVSPYLVDSFYRDLVGVFKEGGFNEVEDEIGALPPQRHPALTIHQAKGLEFPITFIVANQPIRGPGPEHHQEELFYPYRETRSQEVEEFTQQERAIHDAIRQFFVAISRAKALCVITLEKDIYESLQNKDPDTMAAYPYLPPEWLTDLPTQFVDDE